MALERERTTNVMPDFIIEPVDITELRRDARYQRDVVEADVNRIVRGYQKERFQPVVVGMRADGELHVVDGQHRLAAAKIMGWTHVPCQIFESRGFEHEAEVYEALQEDRRQLTVGQRWKSRVARKEPRAVAITELVTSLGLRLDDKIGPTSISSYTACERAHDRDNLRDTLVLIIQAWDYDLSGWRAQVLDAVSTFLAALRAENFQIDMERARLALARIKPSQFFREAAVSGNPNAVFMRMWLEKYNSGLRNGRIEVEDPVGLLQKIRHRKGGETTARAYAAGSRPLGGAAAAAVARTRGTGK